MMRLAVACGNRDVMAVAVEGLATMILDIFAAKAEEMRHITLARTIYLEIQSRLS